MLIYPHMASVLSCAQTPVSEKNHVSQKKYRLETIVSPNKGLSVEKRGSYKSYTLIEPESVHSR